MHVLELYLTCTHTTGKIHFQALDFLNVTSYILVYRYRPFGTTYWSTFSRVVVS